MRSLVLEIITDFAYLRISKDRKGAGLGVERQKHDITEYRARCGMRPVQKWYVDNDISASDRRKKRPDYRAMLLDIQMGYIANDAVMSTWHTDRLHRNMTEIEEFIDVLLPTKITVEPVKTSPFDFSTAAGRMFARQMGVQAQYFAEHMGEQLKGKKEELARKGVKLGGGRPFGYTEDGMELDPFESKLVEAGIDYILQGGAIYAVTQAWNEAGAVTTRAKKPFRPDAVREVLSRKRNAGLMQLRGEVVGKAGWPEIVSADKLNAFLNLIQDPTRRTNSGAQPKWLGTGLFRCGVCLKPMIVTNAKYVCRPRAATKRDDGLRHANRNAVRVDALVESLIVAYISDPDTARALQQAPGESHDLQALRVEMAGIEEKQKQLAGMLSQTGFTMEMLIEANAGLSKRKGEIDAILTEAASSSLTAGLVIGGGVDTAWKEAVLDKKRSILKELMVVTIMPERGAIRKGLPRDQPRFDPNLIEVAWVGVPLAA